MANRTLARTRDDLSDFLLRHRRRLSPADVGLPVAGRRRTPGLRREEVAALAGVGLTWYTWFEQGRDIGVSEDFLLNVARALRLDDAECCHLFLLAHRRPPPPEAYQLEVVPPLVQQLMDDLSMRPAYIINLRWDIVAWNAAADRLFGLAGKAPPERNFLRMLFTDPQLRVRLPGWQQDAPRVLMQFRCDLAMAPEDPAMLALIETLQDLSPDFRRWWRRPEVEGYSRGVHAVLDDDGATVLRFQHALMTVDEYRHLQMVIYFADAGSERPA